MDSKRLINLLVSWSFMYIPILMIIIGVSTHHGYKEGYSGYFFNAALVAILLVTFTTKSFFQHSIKAIIMMILIFLSQELFWSYMDHPWFAGPEKNTCDGPCFGWFSFENFSFGFFLAIISVPIIICIGVVKSTFLKLIKIIKIKKAT